MNITNPGAHIDQMLRQTRAHHVQLSSMADLKANMLLTMASVVITLSAPHLVRDHFKLPAAILIVFCLGTIMLASYAAMPKSRVRLGHDHPDTSASSFNILFFGDFTRLTYPEYERAMETVLNDPSRTYEVQIREVYTLGLFLASKKYRFLRMAYLSFITGLLSSGSLLLWAELFG